MAKELKVRLNEKCSGFSVFEIDEKGNYLRCIDPSAHLNNGKVELRGCLYDGVELFAEIVKRFYRDTKVKGFTIMGYNVKADDYLLFCRVPLELVTKRPGFQEYEFVR